MHIKESNKSILFLLLIFVAVLSMSIGYCLVNEVTLNIQGTAYATPEKTLYIESIELDNDKTTTGGKYESYITTNTLLQISSITLPDTNVTSDTNVTILVHVKNVTDLSYKFTGISYLTAEDLEGYDSFSVVNSNPNIEIDKTSYQDKIDTIITGADADGPGEMTISVKFKYKDISNITDNKLNIAIKLKFDSLEDQQYKLKTGKNFYSVISDKYTTATKVIFCDKTEVPKGATEIGDVGLTDGEIIAYWDNSTIYISTMTRKSTIVFNEDSGYMFSNGLTSNAFSDVTSFEISSGVKIDTSNVTKFEEMFKGCSSVTSKGIQGFINQFDTSNAANMCAMFGSTSNITTLDLSGFDTKNVTDMSWMLEDNSKLTEVNFGGKFDTSSVKGTKENQGFSGMFNNCAKLITLDLTGFDTANVASMWRMFSGCENLQRIYVSNKFVTTGLNSTTIPNSVNDVFKNCAKLEGYKGTKLSEENITTASYARIDEGTNKPGYFSILQQFTVEFNANGGIFEDGETTKTYSGTNKLEMNIDFKPTKENRIFIGWAETADSKNPTYYNNENSVFFADKVLYAVWLNGETYTLKTGTTIFSMISDYKTITEHVKFTNIEKIPTGSTEIGNADASNTGNIKLYYNTNEKTIYFAIADSDIKINFNQDSSHMFSNGNSVETAFNKLQTIEVEGGTEIDTSEVENFQEIFKYNVSLTQDSIQTFIKKLNTSSVTNMCAMFEYLSISEIDVSSFDTSRVTDMSWMFHGGSYTNIILGSKFDTSKVTKFDGMFQDMPNMVNLDISVIKVKNGASIEYMFGKCPKLQKIYVSEDSGFENARTAVKVFENCTSLVGGVSPNETQFTSDEISNTYARISKENQPGYFTSINDK